MPHDTNTLPLPFPKGSRFRAKEAKFIDRDMTGREGGILGYVGIANGYFAPSSCFVMFDSDKHRRVLGFEEMEKIDEKSEDIDGNQDA